jgi:hypothetical protein
MLKAAVRVLLGQQEATGRLPSSLQHSTEIQERAIRENIWLRVG